MNPIEVKRENIWEYPQNRPKLVVRDLEQAFDLDGWGRMVVSSILLARGVNKWLANRKRFIRLKHEIKREITETHKLMDTAKKEGKHQERMYLRGRLSAMVEIREKMREICKSGRWVNIF